MTRVRVLITEPDLLLLETYGEFLRKDPLEIALSANGPDCMRLLRDFRPHILVLEPDLDDGWGDRLLEAMRTDPTASGIPVIVATRQDCSDHEYPICEWLVKPFSMMRLLRSIATHTPLGSRFSQLNHFARTREQQELDDG